MGKLTAFIGLLCTAAVMGCESATVPARAAEQVFEFRLPVNADRLVLRWPNAARIRVFVQPGLTEPLTELLQSAVRAGAMEWQSVSLFGDYSFALVGIPEQADVVVSWSTAIRPVEVADCTPIGGAAFTTFCLTPEGDRLKPFPLRNSTAASSVRFLVTIRESEAINSARVHTLVMHELGHVLGIAAHSPDQQDLMFADPGIRDAPSARDRATVQLLYQTRPNITP
ncbi:MAG: hypothetical protein WEE89_02185 [Gemmatimonadota bacterium]